MACRSTSAPGTALLACLLAASCSTTPSVAADAGGGVVIVEVTCRDPHGDEDKDGLSNIEEGCPLRDSDGDHIPDWQDFDSDDDHLADHIEVGERDSAGRCKGAPQSGWPCDTDGDKTPDYLDLDSDGDGLLDGDEDANRDGLLGCCLAQCKQPGPAQGNACILSEEGCGRGQTCVDGLCTPAVAFDCSGGETDPTKTSTFGDKLDSALGTFVCRETSANNPQGHRRLQLHRSIGGDWTLALRPGARYQELELPGAGVKEAAAVIDNGSLEVAGFVVSQDTNTLHVQDQLTGLLQQLAGESPDVISIRAAGEPGKSHDQYDAVLRTVLDITLPGAATVSTVRNHLVAVLLGRPIAQLGDLPGPHSSPRGEVVVRLVTVKRFEFKKTSLGNLVQDADGYPVDSGDRSKWRLLIMGAVAARADFDAPSEASLALHDLSNGTALARGNYKPRYECDARTLAVPATVGLDRPPISASIAVALDGKRVPRSRAAGFDYDEASRAVVLSGLAIGPKSQLLVSYGTWRASLEEVW